MSALFGFPIRSDAGTFSGGSWRSTLPLNNLKDRDMSKKARSTDATSANTKFDVDLGAATYPIRGIALLGHNLTLAATVRVYGDDASNFAAPNYNPGAVNAYPTIYPAATTLWGIDVSNSALTAIEYADGARLPFIHLPASAQTLRYWRIEIVDTANPDGYVEIGRCVIFQGWQPSRRPAVGFKHGFDSFSRRVENDGGTWRYRARPRFKRLVFTLPLLPQNEALVQVPELLRRVGTTEQLFFVTDVADTVHLHRRSMLATLEQATALETPFAGDWQSVPFALVEEIAP